MDGHKKKSQGKLTRTQSSLLRASPTVRSSIHSLSSMSHITQEDQEPDLEEQKPHHTPSPVRPEKTKKTRFVPALAASSLSLYALFLFLREDQVPTSENLLLALALVALALFLAGKNKGFFPHFLVAIKQVKNRLSFSSKTRLHNNKPVTWFIGESDLGDQKGQKRVILEGVEFYSNGDFYEGEFHGGKCNGSGVYNYFVNGRYEGDWIDGKYDGCGIESWARGSRYRGQYRQGLRHGFGVYRFFTGDVYAGEWFRGQSHGVGAQTCSDGSCYVGEFKCGVKHGLGCYHFR